LRFATTSCVAREWKPVRSGLARPRARFVAECCRPVAFRNTCCSPWRESAPNRPSGARSHTQSSCYATTSCIPQRLPVQTGLPRRCSARRLTRDVHTVRFLMLGGGALPWRPFLTKDPHRPEDEQMLDRGPDPGRGTRTRRGVGGQAACLDKLGQVRSRTLRDEDARHRLELVERDDATGLHVGGAFLGPIPCAWDRVEDRRDRRGLGIYLIDRGRLGN
jgi:hypothetical protein